MIFIGIILVALHFIVVGNGIGYFISGICLLILRVFLIWIFEKYLDLEKKRKLMHLDFLLVLLTDTLRHTGCTRLGENNVNPKAMQYVMGHSDAKICMACSVHKIFTKKISTQHLLLQRSFCLSS